MISTETDTIDHHRSDEALRERENYLETIFNSVQTGLLVIDPETHSIVDVNPAASELIGLDRSLIVGSICHQFICPAEAGKCPITDLGQKIDNSERVLLKADGSRIPILKTGIAIKINGRDYLLESFLDISERKTLEGELQESETKFKDLAERALVGIYLIQDGIFKYVNPKFAEIHGYSVDEMQGVLGPKDVIYPDDCPVAAENIRKRLSGESQSIRYETRIVTKNGDIRSVELFGSRTIFQGRPGVVGTALDTTERKKSYEALKKSEERLNMTLDAVNDGIWEWNLQTNDAVFSPRYFTMLGYEPDEFPQNYASWKSLIHPDDLDRAEQDIKRSTDSGKSFAIEMRIRTKSGDWRWILSRGMVVERDPEGHPIRMLGTHSDISGRKQAEVALREAKLVADQSRARYEQAVSMISDVVWRHDIDPEGEYIGSYISPVADRMLGLPDGSIGDSFERFFSYVHLDDLPTVQEGLSEEIRTVSKDFTREFRLIKADGTTLWVRSRGSVYSQPDGRITVFGTTSDISEGKKGEEALREAKDYLETLIDYANAPIIVWDSSFNITRFNHAFERLTQKSAVEVLGKNLEILFPEDSKARSLEYIKRTSSGERWEVVEIPILRSDGSVRIVLWNSANIFDKDGTTILTTIAQGQDITERKISEDAIKESQRRLTDIIDFLPDATFAVDKAGLVIAWNRAMEEMTGIGRNEMLGQGDHAYTVPFYGKRRPQLLDLLDEDDNEIASNYQNVQRRGNSLYAEAFTPALRQGKGAYVWATAGPIFDVLGNRVGAIESIRDITGRKYEQDELKNNLRFLEALIETIPSPIFFLDRQGRYLGCNDAFARQIIGMPKENIVGKTVFELPTAIPPDLAEMYYEQDQKLFRELGIQEYEMEVQCSDGEKRDFFFTKATFKNHTGDVAGIVGVMLDITKRKQAELNLESSIIRQKRLNRLQSDLLAPAKLEQKLEMITDGVVDIFGADFCRIWITSPGDLCDTGCKHANVTEGPHICRHRDQCLRLIASSGRYTHTNGDDHKRVPFGCYKIGLVASGEEHKFLTNDAQNDPRVHNHEWAEEIGLVSFAGYQLRPPGGDTVGVLALFSKQTITSEDDAQLDNLSNMTALIIQADRINEDLRASNQIIEGIINAIPLRVFWKDKNLVFLGCNATFAHDAGFADSKDIIGKDDYQMGWRDQAELYRSDDRQVIESGCSKLFVEEPQTSPEGNPIVLLRSKVPLQSSDGEIVGVIGTYMDITERKQMETLQRESKEFLDKIINSISDPIFVVDRQHRHILVNKAMCEMSNRTREEFIGKTPYDFFPQEQVDIFVERDEEVFETGKENVNEETITDSQGAVRTIVTKKTLYTDASGNKSIVGIIMDITDRKKTEEALKIAHDQLLGIIDFLPDATFVINKEGIVIAWNRAIETMTEVRAEDILGKGNYEYAIPFYGERRPVLIDLLLQRVKEIEDKYVRIERKDESLEGEAYMPNMNSGAVYLYGKAAVLYDSTGNLYGAIESIRDITDRKNAEQIRERLVKELESKNAEMERFTYTVSHDLRSPLITVSGLVGFLKSDLEKGNTTRATTFLERITGAIAKMDNLLKDTLELSRIGRVANPPDNVNFDDIVQDALSQVQERITKSGTKITVAEAMPDVFVDRMRIVEVMVNLIENGIKYMGDQAHPEIEIGHLTKDGQHTFFVKDNGMGIDPGQFDKVFELFYKVNDKSEGTGAGLAIVKRIIEVQGGRIWVESGDGKGSTFCFNLPDQPSKGA